jgi:hypothetical protein
MQRPALQPRPREHGASNPAIDAAIETSEFDECGCCAITASRIAATAMRA